MSSLTLDRERWRTVGNTKYVCSVQELYWLKVMMIMIIILSGHRDNCNTYDIIASFLCACAVLPVAPEGFRGISALAQYAGGAASIFS